MQKTHMFHMHWLAVISLVLAVLFLSACGSGTGITLDERAQAFAGGALSAFAGPDGDDLGARGTARDLTIGREYDCIIVGYLVAAGAATSNRGSASSRFEAGSGQLAVDGDEATLTLEINNVDPDVVDAQLIGYFSVSEAQQAVEDAGASFIVVWEIEFTENEVSYSLLADQLLSGTDWVEL